MLHERNTDLVVISSKLPTLDSLFVSWAQSTTKDYIRARTNVQSVSYLLCTQVTKPQIIPKNTKSVLTQIYRKHTQTSNTECRRTSPFGIAPVKKKKKKAHEARHRGNASVNKHVVQSTRGVVADSKSKQFIPLCELWKRRKDGRPRWLFGVWYCHDVLRDSDGPLILFSSVCRNTRGDPNGIINSYFVG